jgi:RHS repeat-associated protein
MNIPFLGGYERDNETGLDFAQARYFSNVQGRFTSPDEPFADQYEGDPQSWNLYAYVRNNPLNATDPTGRETCYYNGNTVLACEGAKNYRIDYENNLIYIRDKKGNEAPYTLDARFIVRGSQGADTLPYFLPSNRQFATAVFGLWGASVAIGATGGGAAFAGGATVGGSSVTTLGLSGGSTGVGATTAATATATILPQFSGSTITQAVRAVMGDPNKLIHIFGKAQHNLGPLVQQLGGQSNTIQTVLNAANGSLPASGSFATTVVVQGFTVELRGAVVNGAIRIGTMFVK